MSNLLFKNAAVDFLFAGFIPAFAVFNDIEPHVPAEKKAIFNSLKQNYKNAVNNIDSDYAKYILRQTNWFFNSLVKIEKEAFIPEEAIVKPINQYTNKHLWARDVIRVAFKRLFGRYPTLSEEQLAQSTALLESHYGMGWKEGGKDSNNWGAVQCCKPKNGTCPTNAFLYTDTTPQKDGTSKKYSICFKKYDSPVDGAVDLLKEIFQSGYKARGQKTQMAAQLGSIPMFSASMYDGSYYEGFGSDREARIRNHAKAIQKNLDIITKATGSSIAAAGNIAAIPTEDQINQYVASKGNNMTQPNEQQVLIPNKELDQEYNSLMKNLFAEDMSSIEKRAIYREKLPLSRNLVTLDKGPFELRVRLANILVTAFRNYFDAETSIHSDGRDKVELEVDMFGSKEATAKALKAVTSAVSNSFCDIIKNNEKEIVSNIYTDTSSKFALLDLNLSEKCFRKFALQVW